MIHTKAFFKTISPRSIAGLLIFGLSIVAVVTTKTHSQRHGGSILSVKTEAVEPQQRNKLLKRDRERLAQARAEGKIEVSIVIASLPGHNQDVVNNLIRLDAQIRYRADDVDYVRAKVPIENVHTLASLEGIQVINLDGATFTNTSYNPFEDTTVADKRVVSTTTNTQDKIEPPNKIAPPNRDTPPENPYLPTRDMGAPQFVANHPTFDGRGVAIAIFEGGIADVLTPQLESATTLDGKPTRKLLDVLDAYDPVDDANYKVNMNEDAVAISNHFAKNGTTYTAPADGRYKFGFFDESQFSSEQIMSDINYDGNPPGSSRLFAVIWDQSTNIIWVDTNQDHSFADEKAMTDYSVKYDLGVFGKDDPKTPIRESVAFLIKSNRGDQFIRILPLIFDHANLTTNVAMGRSYYGGNANGVAPGAQFLSVMKSYTYHGMIEGMILAMRDPRVDIVSVQVASVERLNDGNSTISIIWDRLVERYKKPLFVGANNAGPGINTVNEVTSGSKVISVGGYVSGDTFLSVFGMRTDKHDYVVNLSGRGPRDDGGFKPDIITPTAGVLFSSPAFKKLIIALKPPYVLPHGYYVGSGTSMATPMASGAAALLVSAAKQTGVQWDSDRLRWAMKSSARYLPEYRVNAQGSGLIQVGLAWEALKRAPENVAITSRAPVKNVLSKYLKEPNLGQGLYEREGWQAGRTARRQISFTRTSGEAQPISYWLRWKGNDGTFTAPQSVSLPLNTTVSINVGINPVTAGVHSAALQIIDERDSHIVYETMNTVVAAEQFTKSNGFTISRDGQLAHPEQRSYFFNVPAGTSAFRFDLKVLQGSLRATFMTPAGSMYGAFSPPLEAYVPYEYRTSGTQSQTIVNPEPGVWEVVIDNNDWMDARGVLSQEQGRFTFKASVFAVETEVSDLIQNSTTNPLVRLASNFTNRMAPFVGSVNSGPLGSAFIDSPTLVQNGAPKIYDIDVPPATESLTARITPPNNSSADLDLYLYKCAGTICTLKAFSIGDGAREMVKVLKPEPGKWKAVIDPVNVPSGKIQYDYSDTFTNQLFGELSAAGEARQKSTGTSWQETMKFRVASRPQAPRFLVAVAEVTNSQLDTVGYKWSGETGPNYTSEPRYKPIDGRVALGSAVWKIANDPDTSRSN